MKGDNDEFILKLAGAMKIDTNSVDWYESGMFE